MNNTTRGAASLAGSLITLAWAPSVWAGSPGGTIDYEPLAAATSVPTLGEWGLVLMALLVGVVAYRALRGRVNGRLLVHLLLGGGLVTGGLAGGDLVRSARAVSEGPSEVNMTQAGGGSVLVIDYDTVVKVNNVAGVPLRIKAMTPNAEYLHWGDPSPSSPQCTVGLVVPAGGACYVLVEAEPV